MTFPKAVVFVDPHCAKILQFGPELTHERKVNAPVDNANGNELVALARQWFTHQAHSSGMAA